MLRRGRGVRGRSRRNIGDLAKVESRLEGRWKSRPLPGARGLRDGVLLTLGATTRVSRGTCEEDSEGDIGC